MQPTKIAPTDPTGEFQSSPDPEAGCNSRSRSQPLLQRGVSILTRPGGRVQLYAVLPEERKGKGFNPHPTRRPGATRIFFIYSSP